MSASCEAEDLVDPDNKEHGSDTMRTSEPAGPESVEETNATVAEQTPINTVTAFKVPVLNVKPHPSQVFSDKTANKDNEASVSIEEKGTANKKEASLEPPAASKPKPKSRTLQLSPAELLKQSQVPIPYKEPVWGGLCEEKYSFEVIKNGSVLNTVDLSTKSYYVFGRLPNCDVSMEHPSLSRHHAVVQHCKSTTENQQKGWYLYDLDSTHGTWINKKKIPGKKYHRLRVGFVLKFGGSTRLHILQGPNEDQEDESTLTVTEMKQQRERKIKEEEILRQVKLVEIEEEKKEDIEKEGDEGCSWGMDGDAFEIDSNNPFALVVPQNEELYIDDPKKSLRGYFEREGLELPEYEVEDLEMGKYQCKVELPVDNEITGEPIIALATVTGKKKDVVAACALEACRILDKMGELRKANHESRKRKAKNWEENDFYDSDDDIFLDRTGDIERKRKLRMQRLGKSKAKQVQTYDSIMSQLDEIEKEMSEIQKKLDKAKAEAEAVEAEEGLDALDAFMANIKSGSMDTKTRMSLKRRMFDLKQEQMKLQKLAKVAKPASIPECSNLKKSPVAGKPLLTFGKIKSHTEKTQAVTKVPANNADTMDTEFKEEMEDDEEDADKKIISDKENKTENITSEETELNSTDSDNTKQIKENSDLKNTTSKIDNIDIEKMDVSSSESAVCKNQSEEVGNASGQDIGDFKSNQSEKVCNASGQDIGDVKSKVKGPSLPPTDEFEKEPSEKSSSKKRVRIRKKKPKKDEGASFDPEIATWLPPEGQSGDGKTRLNAKFGY